MRQQARCSAAVRVIVTLVAAALTSTVPAAADAPPPAAPGPAPGGGAATPLAETIHAADLMRTIGQLASPQLQGRLAGSPGYLEAATMAADQFRRLGLRPGGGVSAPATPGAKPDRGTDTGPDSTAAYFQDLSVEYNPIGECALALVRADGSVRDLDPGRDFACRGLTGSGHVTAPVVFAGYGLSSPGKGYDDYAGIDVRGKIVLAFKEPPPFTADSTGWGDEWMPAPKGRVAAAHGAAGLLVVSRPGQEHPQRPIGSMLEGEAPHDAAFPRLQVAVDVAGEMVSGTGFTLGELESRIDSTHAPASRALDLSARIGVQADYEPGRRSVNVVGILEGSDPVLRNEYVVLGAHLDHVGTQGAVLYPGANDNASGSATVLAIASALARAESRPKRSVIFGLWSSEEAGLFGAREFVDHPPVPRGSIVSYLNFDCVGHGDSIEVHGGKSYPGPWEAARALDRRAAGLLVGETGGGGGADAAPFEEAGIPNLYFASSFSYTHLHLPSDTPETLNPALLEAVARLGAGLARGIAEGEIPVR
jgi:Zn-dependent M28 family amino/carboxypeptidase